MTSCARGLAKFGAMDVRALATFGARAFIKARVGGFGYVLTDHVPDSDGNQEGDDFGKPGVIRRTLHCRKGRVVLRDVP